jgi:hypothetical protein
MRCAFAQLALILIVVGVPADAQYPDFSGRWSLSDSIPPVATAASELIVKQESTSVSRDGRPMASPLVSIEIQRRTGSIIRTARYTIGIMGGTVGSGPGNEVSQSRHSAAWEGDRFVIDLAFYSGPATAPVLVSARHEVWSLRGPDTLVIELKEAESGRPAQTSLLTYRR